MNNISNVVVGKTPLNVAFVFFYFGHNQGERITPIKFKEYRIVTFSKSNVIWHHENAEVDLFEIQLFLTSSV